jgi:hypothetical protein
VPDGGGDVDILFSGDRPITRNPQTIFNTQCFPSGQTGTVKDFLECVFFPDRSPSVSIWPSVQYAKQSASTKAHTFNWSVAKTTNDIASITFTQNGGITGVPASVTANP